ncbi:MAG TPA: tetratricopeptide repeat protein [Gemmatimonadaceae bacterium]|nr:tetratricopeptide repeat protein [Gemmatimonadaceae bacterium]
MSNTPGAKAEFDFSAFYARYRKPILAGAAAAVVLGAGAWFWRASNNLKEKNGELAYVSAERSFYSGNLQLAEIDLARVVTRYGTTKAGVRASMLLARAMYQQGKADSGVKRLREAVGHGAAGPFRAAIYAMIAAGLEDGAKYDSAAASFGQAAAAAATPIDREIYKADQARSLASAGKPAEALRIWQEIAAREGSPLIAEARLRIGELTAAPAKGS